MVTPRIHIDPSRFEPWKVQALTHALASHPLLQIDSLVELGKRQQARKLVRTHSDDAKPATSFAEAPNLHPNRKSAEETLRDMHNAKAWLSLLNVQADPIYRAFIDEILDEVKPIVSVRDPGMGYRAGWIFVTSPNAVTPFHIDHEHNFILQIRGTKTLHVWDPFDRVVVSEEAQERFHDAHSRETIAYRDEFLSRAQTFALEPGLGGYMPSTAPHLVKNGPEVSITVSFTYYTDSTRARELLYRGNARLRRLGLSPRPVGASPSRDAAKRLVLESYMQVKRRVDRVLGRSAGSNLAPYAPA
jgi:hypothetical protein